MPVSYTHLDVYKRQAAGAGPPPDPAIGPGRLSTAPAAGGASRAKRLLWIAPFAIYLALAGTGITWGLPNDHSWSNDDIAPNTVLRVGEFYWGASHKYPYLQLFIDRAL